uniref:Membrane transporter protein n=1 Tax=Panagrellus redivivus TaxID=6233 RepID=A0A7E4UN58_PANRE
MIQSTIQIVWPVAGYTVLLDCLPASVQGNHAITAVVGPVKGCIWLRKERVRMYPTTLTKYGWPGSVTVAAVVTDTRGLLSLKGLSRRYRSASRKGIPYPERQCHGCIWLRADASVYNGVMISVYSSLVMSLQPGMYPPPVDETPTVGLAKRSGMFFKKYFLHGQNLDDRLQRRLDADRGNLPWYERHRKYLSFIIPITFWHLVWWPLAVRYNFFALFPTRWVMPVTMILGATVAGATCEGSGPVIFPVMTMLLNIEPIIARDFALMIQSCGMTSATFAVFFMRVKVDWPAIIFVTLGASISIIFGLEYIDDLIGAQVKKMLFVSIWFSFAISLFILNLQKKRKTFDKIQNFNWKKAVILFITGIVGGLCTAFAGAGVNICAFCILTLFFHVSEKVATPTTVIMMAANALIGFYWRHAIMTDVAEVTWEYFEVSIPVAVVFAPLGAFLSSHCHRQVLASFVYILKVVSLIGFLATGPPLYLVLIGGVVIVLSLPFFLALIFIGSRVHGLDKHEIVVEKSALPITDFSYH